MAPLPGGATQMESEIMALAGSSPLPVPIEIPANGKDRWISLDQASSRILGSSPPVGISPRGASPPVLAPVAPYQALPVTPSIITEHLTPALDVIDHTQLTPEASAHAGAPPRAAAAAAAAAPPLTPPPLPLPRRPRPRRSSSRASTR